VELDFSWKLMSQHRILNKNIQTRILPRLLSPMSDPTAPEALRFEGADRFWRLFRSRSSVRSTLRLRRSESAQDFFEAVAKAKLRSDIEMGYDISIIPYPLGFAPDGWGVLADRLGRLFTAVPSTGDNMELQYQNGKCRSLRDWHAIVESRTEDEQDRIRFFYNRIRVMADNRITVAGTAGFGLWDSLWMSFDFETAIEMLSRNPDFANVVIGHWKSFHLAAVSAMLDAGVKTIFLRENSRGFSQIRGISTLLDPFLREHFTELSRAVHSRGGSLLLDCDADEMIETECPMQWGFDGVGPMLFRDTEDIISARRSLNPAIALVGTTLFPFMPGAFANRGVRAQNLILAIANGSLPVVDRRETNPKASSFSKFLRTFISPAG
jgi:hypothetical protein